MSFTYSGSMVLLAMISLTTVLGYYRNLTSRYYNHIQWTLVLVALFVSAGVALSKLSPFKEWAGFLTSRPDKAIDSLGALALIIEMMLLHIGFSKQLLTAHPKIWIYELGIALVVVTSITASDMLFLVFLVPVYIVLITGIPLLANAKLNPRQAIKLRRGLYLSLFIFLGLCLIAVQFQRLFGTLEFNSIQGQISQFSSSAKSMMGGIEANNQAAILYGFEDAWWLGFVIFLFILFTLPLTIFDLQDSEDHRYLDSLIQLLHSSFAFVLVLKWSFSLSVVWTDHLDNFLISTFDLELIPVTFTVIFVWLTILSIRGPTRFGQYPIWQMQLICLSGIGIFGGSLQGCYWGFTLFLLAILTGPLVGRIQARQTSNISWTERDLVVIFLLLLLLSPIGNISALRIVEALLENQSMFQLMEGQMSRENLWKFGFLCAAALSVAMLGLRFLNSPFHDLGSHGEIKKGHRSIFGNYQDLGVVGYVWLIAVLFVGIYPYPLYKYVRLALHFGD